MEQLIKITENNGQKVVSARELHEFLVKDAKGGQIGEMFSHWIKRNLEYLEAKENTDYVIIEYDYLGNDIAKISKSDLQKVIVHKREYALSINCAKQISMIQNNDKGKQARLYFIECEKQLKDKKQITELSRKQLALMVIEAEEELEKKNEEIKTLTPKAEVFDKVMSSDTCIDIGDCSKVLNLKGIGRNKLFETLRKKQILNNYNIPYQQYITQGYFKCIETPYSIGEKIRVHVKTLITQKGLSWITKILN